MAQEDTTPLPEPVSAHIIIRDGSVIYEGDVLLPDLGMFTIDSHDVDARSVLAILYALDQNEDSFKISDLSYYSSFSAFYLRCITLEEEKCDYWMYEVNNKAPSVGMDSFILSGGEEVEVYFDDSFFGSGDEEEVEVAGEEEAIEEEEEIILEAEEPEVRQTSSGSRARKKSEEQEEQTIIEEIPIVAQAPVEFPAVVPEKITTTPETPPILGGEEDEVTPEVLSAAVGISDATPKAPWVLGGVTLLTILVLVGRKLVAK